MNNLFVVTGGPGTGKTTLLKALAADGYKVIPEAARVIIREQTKTGGDALPWKNQQLYTDKMLMASIADYKAIQESRSSEISFFDRGVLDAVCYAEMIGYKLSYQVMKEVLRCLYHPTVFILPPWKEIYQTDGERKQDWHEAEQTCAQMKKVYERFGYEIIEVPVGNIAERKEFVLTCIHER